MMNNHKNKNKDDNNTNTNTNTKRKKKQIAYRARHRLHSIHLDAIALESHPLFPNNNNNNSNNNKNDDSLPLPSFCIVANKRCGSWYLRQHHYENETETNNNINKSSSSSSSCCYFKSTDGHSHFMSWKRLNLHLLEPNDNGDDDDKASRHLLIVDSSVRKALPDSCSRTIPLWACVLNRLVLKYYDYYLKKDDNNDNDNDNDDARMSSSSPSSSFWDTKLYTPFNLVSSEEHDKMESVIDDHVERMYESGVIVNPQKFLNCMTKPLRPYWITNSGNNNNNNNNNNNAEQTMKDIYADQSKYKAILCWNPCTVKNRYQWNDENQYYYTPGAADDEESWARHLTPSIFWKYTDRLLHPKLDEDAVDAEIDIVVNLEKEQNKDNGGCGGDGGDTTTNDNNNNNNNNNNNQYAHQIGELNLWLGSRRAGKPPECWKSFDAILNVTMQDYDGMEENSDLDSNESPRFYLKLPVEEGKRDRSELERWMPVGLLFLIHHLQAHHQQNDSSSHRHPRRVLVHCAQGKDRSVALVLAYLVLMCRPLTFPLRVTTGHINLSTLLVHVDSTEKENDSHYLRSGLAESLVTRLLQKDEGHTLFLKWMHSELNNNDNNCAPIEKPLADKERIRIGLQLIRQDRQAADPTRSTLQKLNRFFMSSPLYR